MDATVQPPRSKLSSAMMQAESYNRRGFFVFDHALDADTVARAITEIDPWEAKVERYLQTQPNGRRFIAEAGGISFTTDLVKHSQFIRDLSASPIIAGVCRDLLGPNVRLYRDQAVYKKPEYPKLFLVAGLHIGAWSIDSWSTPRAAKLPARSPIALNDLQQALDAEFAPVVKDGLLKQSTGCGVAIGILDHDQRRVFTYGAAYADSIFEIGSVTKTFTGLALAQLAAQGKVRLDEPIRPLVFPNVAAASVSGEITLLDLVTHRSGLLQRSREPRAERSRQSVRRL